MIPFVAKKFLGLFSEVITPIALSEQLDPAKAARKSPPSVKTTVRSDDLQERLPGEFMFVRFLEYDL